MKNKKNILTFVVAMVLVAALSVGGTLAYLTATSNQVTNTFKFADMTVTLKEDPPEKTPDKVKAEENEDPDTHEKIPGVKYTNIEPGQTLPKKPTVTTTTTSDAYLFIKVSGASKTVMPSDEDGNTDANPITDTYEWKKFQQGTKDDFYNGIYYKVITGKNGVQNVGSVFEYVKVSENATGEENIADIKIDVYEIQQSGFIAEGDTEMDSVTKAFAQIPKPFNPAGPDATTTPVEEETETPAA